jgi:hypothetical protein
MRVLWLGFAPIALLAQPEFVQTIRPVLVENCATCHKPGNTKGPVPFLNAEIDANRAMWRNVAAHLRNRTMPPRESKITEEERLRVWSWIDDRLRATACKAGDYAGPAITRRLNRREYRNTVRDLFGIDFDVLGILPADGTGGAGFDTNAETLFIPPILLEKYMEAAQQILDRVIVTPPLSKELPLAKDLSATAPVYLEGPYDVQVEYAPAETPPIVTLKIDGSDVGALAVQRRRNPKAPATMGLQVNLARGSHTFSIRPEGSAPAISRLVIQQRQQQVSPEKRALHYRLFGMEPGERPLDARKAARQILETLLPKAFRRPVDAADADRFMAMYDRAAERGDPYEERVKLALKAVLVWPEFLFRMEQKQTKPGLHPLNQYELATRLSYFLWSTSPDETLIRLAEQGRLQDSKVLAAQVDRMLDSGRSRTFVNSFIGQWLGTQDIGGRVVPLITELQAY